MLQSQKSKQTIILSHLGEESTILAQMEKDAQISAEKKNDKQNVGGSRDSSLDQEMDDQA